MKSFKDWKNKKQYLEFSVNPDAQPVINPNSSNGLMRDPNLVLFLITPIKHKTQRRP